MPTVFLSHSSLDKSFVRRLTRDLEGYGVDVWLDEREIRAGDSLVQSIETALDSCGYGIVVLSEGALGRPWVERELRALYTLEIDRRRKVIIPALISSTKLPLFLRDKKYADFTTDYDIGLGELLRVFDEPDRSRQLETLACSVVVDLVTADGRLARPIKRQTIRCVRGSVDRYLDVCSADGRIENIKIAPGRVVRTWREVGLLYVESEFPRPLREGETLEHLLDSNFIDSFLAQDESWEERQYHPTRELSIEVLFPSERPPVRAAAYERRGPNLTVIEGELVPNEVNGRMRIRLIVDRPRLLSTYRIEWRW